MWRAGSKQASQVSNPPTYVSYLIRLWRESRPDLPETSADWQGEIEHIQSGQRWIFGTLDELLSLLRRQVAINDRIRSAGS
jgi:hypothetical protein